MDRQKIKVKDSGFCVLRVQKVTRKDEETELAESTDDIMNTGAET